MASQKQELIQLHQLLAETRYFAKDKLDLNAKIEDLNEYREIGVTSMNLNADIQSQTDAILALASNLSDVFSNELETTQSTDSKTAVDETSKSSIPTSTVATKLYQVTDDGIDTEAVVANQPVSSKSENETVVADSSKKPYGSTESSPVVVSKTSLTDFIPEPETESETDPVTEQNVATTEETQTSETPEQATLPAV